MQHLKVFILFLLFMTTSLTAQNDPFEQFNFLLGNWKGTGSGFGNEQSKIQSEFNLIMTGKYIEVKNDSKFEPTESEPEGEHHIDWGIISFDKNREKIIFRQFNIEGYVNQYVLNDSLSGDSVFLFESEVIENFVKGGKTRWTINRIDNENIETVFEVSFPGKAYGCFGRNNLTKQE